MKYMIIVLVLSFLGCHENGYISHKKFRKVEVGAKLLVEGGYTTDEGKKYNYSFKILIR